VAEVTTYSSVRGVIFFSSISSSAKFFLYFSQFCPVAEGIVSQDVVSIVRGDIVAEGDEADEVVKFEAGCT
jgi:hypothetical protein